MFPAGALFKSKTTPIRIIPPPTAHRMVPRIINPANSRPINPALQRQINSALPRPTQPALPRPTNPALPRPTNPALPRSTNPALPRPTNPARHILPTTPRGIIPENVPTGKENVKPTSYYERKEFKRQKREQNAKIHVSI